MVMFSILFLLPLFIFLSFQRVLENDENVEEGNEEEDLEEDIPKRKNRTRGRVSWDAAKVLRVIREAKVTQSSGPQIRSPVAPYPRAPLQSTQRKPQTGSGLR